MFYNNSTSQVESNKFRPFLFIVVVFLLVVFTECSKELKDPSEIIEKHFPELIEAEQNQPKKIKIAIDVSGSMKGFSGKSDFQDLLRKTFTAFGPSLEVEYYKFDTAVYRVEGFLSFFDKSIYSGYAANINKALSHLSKDSNELLIVITDLQFNNNQRYFDLVQTFQKEIYTGTYVKLFSARTSFDGLIYPQFIDAMPYRYTGMRPLYALCFGKKNHASFIEKILTRAFDWENSLTLSNYVPTEWNLVSVSSNVYRSENEIAIKNDEDSVALELKMISKAFQEWDDLTAKDVFCELFSLSDTNLIITKLPFVVRNFSIKNSVCELKLFFNKIRVKRYGFLMIYIRPSSIPVWLIHRSCKNISEQSDCTLKLKDFVDDVIRPVSLPYTLAAVKVKIKQR